MNAARSTTLTDTTAPREAHRAPRAVAIWLLVCCALVFAIVVVGGATRLTHSGLSITEWQPIVGTLPPLAAAQWDEAFVKYQATPEYRQVNKGMSLDAFKSIFWWEYAHRLLGRVTGAAFALPLAWFALRRKLPQGLAPQLIAIFALGGLQGALGWYMVQSGLIDDPRVSQLRLAAHLGLALLIFAAMFWLALTLLRPPSKASPTASPSRRAVALRRFALLIVALVFVQALSGSLVAGIRAGFAYNTFPLMNGRVVPPEILSLAPWYRNFADNMATVQFDHRAIAWLLALLIPVFWVLARSRATATRVELAANLLLAALLLQLALGIATLLLVVPVPLAAAHQAGAVLLFAAALNAAHALRVRERGQQRA
ncbi:MAG TPA: COX15/CtaA family protein [Casimicrobiaceae bacterium]|jgi:cytochrome c oxidase assembly protein subunit 15|nr:COX15/CtaA family protein [Casimicrobiaceae bacterium]